MKFGSISSAANANPMVRRAAVAAAAAIVLGGFGYAANEAINNGRWPTFAFASRDSRPQMSAEHQQTDQLMSSVSRLSRSEIVQALIDAPPASPAELARRVNVTASAAHSMSAVPVSDARKWDFGGGTNTGDNWQDLAHSGSDDRAYTIAAPNGDRSSHGIHDQNGANVFYGDGHVEAAQEQAGVQLSTAGGTHIANTPVDGESKIALNGVNTYYDVKTVSGGRLEAGGGRGGRSGGASGNKQSIINYYLPGAPDAQVQKYREKPATSNGTLVLGDVPVSGPVNGPVEANRNKDASQLGIAKTDDLVTQTTPAAPVAASTPITPTASPAVDQPPAKPPTQQPQPAQLKVIRNGEMEFEIDSFDSAFLQVSRIVAEEGGFVSTTNSQKLPNGKVSGTITVRCAPDHLDVLVLKLRALGELKGQRITAQDITKEYTDLGSELRADRAMEERLLAILKSGTGAIKDLLAAEKELGDWRGKIEKIVGQMNYYDNLVSLSTLQLTLTEKDIKTPALASQTETVDMGVETEDVEKARTDAIKAVDDAKGRIVASELKKFEAGQLAAKIVADVSPDAAGPVIDRLKQLGKVARLDVERAEVTTDGHGNVVNPDTMPAGLRVEHKDTRLTVSLYNLANVAPRQTANLELACDDVEASYHAVLDRVAKAGGRVVASNLNRPKPDQVTGSINFEVKNTDADAVLMDIRQSGDVMLLTVTENPDTNNVTSTKRGFSVEMRALASVTPREVRSMHLATADVPAAYAKLLMALKAVNARIVLSRLDNEEGPQVPAQNEIAGFIDFEVKRADLDVVEKSLADAGDTFEHKSMRSADEANTLDTKVQFKIGLHNAQVLPARETWTLAVESGDVERAQADVLSAATGAGGRIVDSTLSKETNGRTTARIVVEVPLSQSPIVVDRVKSEGDVRVVESSKNPQGLDGKLAHSRQEITIGSPEAIVSGDQGLWGSIRAGLTTSVAGLLWSLRLIVVGFCFVGPWVLALWVGWKIIKRRKAPSA